MHKSWRGQDQREVAFWASFAVLVAGAWVILLADGFTHSGPLSDLGPGMGLLEELRHLEASSSHGVDMEHGYFELLAMWSLMTAAMMAPTALPFLRTYSKLGRRSGLRPPALALPGLAAGFLAAWFGYAMAAAVLQQHLADAVAVDHAGILSSPLAVAALLALAAAYQATPFKAACLVRCRDPFAFFLARWRNGVGGAFSMGLRQGLACVGCCWALMALAFVGGVMNVVWMAGATAVMFLEKLPDPRHRIRRAIMAGLGVGAAFAGLQAL